MIAIGVVHGTPASYTNHRCRCAPCTKAIRVVMRGRVAARRAELVERNGRPYHPGAATHGVSTYNNWCCRCEVCTDAWKLLRRSHRDDQQGCS